MFSTSAAVAPPPALQIIATPSLPFFDLSTLIKAVSILAPEAPTGCPIATAPPC